MHVENQLSSSQEQSDEPSQPPQGDQTYPGAFPGYPGGSSQPLYGQPSTYSQPMGQSGPYSQPMGYPGSPSVATMAPSRQKRSLKWLWITLAIVGGLAILGGGGGIFALSLYGAPGAAATQFCSYLKAQNYDSAYGMLSTRLKGQYPADQFHTVNAQLDTAEGRVTACAQASGGGAYDYRLGGSMATVVAAITRAKQGNLQGGMHLVNESGWKVDGLDTALLGVNLGALGTLNAFCIALKSQNYTVAYGLLGSSFQSALKQDDFVAQAQIHDTIDGVVTNCALDTVTSSSDIAAALLVAVTRGKLSAASGAIGLAVENGGWKVTRISPQAQGSDLEPLLTGMRFCSLVVAGSWQEAYALLSSAVQQKVTLDSFKSDHFGLPGGYKYLSGTPNLDTYKASPDGGPYDSTVKVQQLSSGSTFTLTLTLFVRPFSEGWRINGWRFS